MLFIFLLLAIDKYQMINEEEGLQVSCKGKNTKNLQ